jgi:hypothetical protein
MDLVRFLPDALSPFIHFDGLVWVLSHTKEPNSVPLFIANRPVLLPPPAFTPFTTTVMLNPRPKDPLGFKLNPVLPLPDAAIDVARNVFPQAKAFLMLFDSSFVVVYDPTEVQCHQMTMVVPKRFGGLVVELDYNYFNFSCALGPELAPRTPESTVVKIVPGNQLFLQGPRYGQEPTNPIPRDANQFIPHIYYGASARSGLLVRDSDDNVFLTTVSHLPILHNEYVSRGERLLGASAITRPVVGTEVRFEAGDEPVSDSGY